MATTESNGQPSFQTKQMQNNEILNDFVESENFDNLDRNNAAYKRSQ